MNGRYIRLIKFTPLFLFTAVWAIVIVLYSYQLYNIRSVSQETFIYLFSSVFTFIVSYSIFVIYDKEFITNTHSQLNLKIDRITFIRIISLLTLSSFIGGMIVFFQVGAVHNGTNIYFENPLIVRYTITHVSDYPELQNFTYRLGNYLMSFGLVSSFYAGIYYIKVDKSGLILFLPIVATIFTSLITFSRFWLISGIGFLFLTILFTSAISTESEKHFIKKKLLTSSLLLLTVAIIMIGGIFALRTFYSDEISNLLVESIYFYMVGGLPALESFMNDRTTHSYGASSFRSIVKWIDLIGLWPFQEAFETHNKFTKVSPSQVSNTYTFIKSLYQDFGFYGLIISMIIWAYLSKFLLNKMFSNFSLYTLFFSVLICFSLLMSFFSFYFQGLSLFIFWLLSIIIIQSTIGQNALQVFQSQNQN